MQSREDYNEFLAVYVLNNEHCESEINMLAQKPEDSGDYEILSWYYRMPLETAD